MEKEDLEDMGLEVIGETNRENDIHPPFFACVTDEFVETDGFAAVIYHKKVVKSEEVSDKVIRNRFYRGGGQPPTDNYYNVGEFDSREEAIDFILLEYELDIEY